MSMVEYIKALWAQYQTEERELRKRLKKINAGRMWNETSMMRDIWFYTRAGVVVFIGGVGILFTAALIVAAINAGLWWITGLIVGV